MNDDAIERMVESAKRIGQLPDLDPAALHCHHCGHALGDQQIDAAYALRTAELDALSDAQAMAWWRSTLTPEELDKYGQAPLTDAERALYEIDGPEEP